MRQETAQHLNIVHTIRRETTDMGSNDIRQIEKLQGAMKLIESRRKNYEQR